MDDLVDAIALAIKLRKKLPPDLVVLIGEPKTLSYDDMQNEISQLLFKKGFTTFRIPKIVAKIGAWVQCHIPFIPPPFIKPWMIDLADDHYELDISRAKKTLGWEPKNNLKASLVKMIAALKSDPVQWYKDNQLGIA